MKNSRFFGMRSSIAAVFIALFCFGLVACTGGEGGEGGGEGAGHEGGGEGGMFVSDGVSRGPLEFPLLEEDESFAGLKGDMEIAIYYNPDTEEFEGRLRNEAPVPVCDISVSIFAADGSLLGQLDPPVEGLVSASSGSGGGEGSEGGESGGGEGSGEHGGGGEGGSEGGGEGRSGTTTDPSRADGLKIPVSAVFSQWQVTIDSHGCSSAPSGSGGGEGPEGGEGGEGSGGEGSGHEGGGSEGGSGSEGPEGSGGGGESSEETDPSTPITEDLMGTDQKNGQAYDFSFNENGKGTKDVFEGTVENPMSESMPVCGSKTEIHVGVDVNSDGMVDSVIELGPTIPVDLEPGDMIKIVMYTDHTFHTYSLHPEGERSMTGTCP